MSIKALKKVLSPPAAPQEAAGVDWAAVESRVGTALPRDYKAFVEAFGTGRIDDFLIVYNPFSSNEFINLIVAAKKDLDAYAQLKGGDYRHDVYPAPGGLLSFAATDNGDRIYWKTDGAPDRWPVVAYESRGPMHAEFSGGMTELLAALLSRSWKCEVFPRNFPSERPVFVPVPPMVAPPKVTHTCRSGEMSFAAHRVWSKEGGDDFPRHRVKLFKSTDGRVSWTPVPMKLALRSRLTHGLFTAWPPQSIDDLSCDGGELVIEFRDHWAPYEKKILPFGLDQESLWRARFDREHQRWSLDRVRHLDYDGPDRPPK